MASPDNTMPRRKPQEGEIPERDPNAGITDAMVKLTPNGRVLAMAIIDRVQAIIGNQQLRNQDEREEVYKAIVDIRYRLGEDSRARAANAEQVAGFLQQVIAQGDTIQREVKDLSQGQAQLRAEFQAVAEAVDDLVAWQKAVDDWRKAAQAQLDTFEITRRESRMNQDRLERKIDDQGARHEKFHAESSADRKSLHAEQEGFKTQLDAIQAAIEDIRRWQQDGE